MTPDEKIKEWANSNASLHFNKEYSPDQHHACVCSYIKGYYDCKNGVNESFKEKNADRISFYEDHLKLLELHKFKLDNEFYLREKEQVNDFIWRLKHYQSATANQIECSISIES